MSYFFEELPDPQQTADTVDRDWVADARSSWQDLVKVAQQCEQHLRRLQLLPLPADRPLVTLANCTVVRGNHLTNTTCLTHLFSKTDE